MDPRALQVDENFIANVGLGSLPPDLMQSLIMNVKYELELRVGTRLEAMMTPYQKAEFENFLNPDTSFAVSYLHQNAPGFETSEQYMNHMAGEGLMQEFAALKWLEINFPRHKEIVAQELSMLAQELTQAAPAILASAQGQVEQPLAAPMPPSDPSQQFQAPADPQGMPPQA